MVDVVYIFAQCTLEEKHYCVSQSLEHKIWTVNNFWGMNMCKIYIDIFLGYLFSQNAIDCPHWSNRLWLRQTCFSSSLHWGRTFNFNYHIDFHYCFDLWDHMESKGFSDWMRQVGFIYTCCGIFLICFSFTFQSIWTSNGSSNVLAWTQTLSQCGKCSWMSLLNVNCKKNKIVSVTTCYITLRQPNKMTLFCQMP